MQMDFQNLMNGQIHLQSKHEIQRKTEHLKQLFHQHLFCNKIESLRYSVLSAFQSHISINYLQILLWLQCIEYLFFLRM